jgi:hypothetical protein
MIRQLLTTVVSASALVCVVNAQSVHPEDSLERAFAAGGRVRLELSSGDYTIRAGNGDRIVVTREGHNRSIDVRQHVRIDASTTNATVRTHGQLHDAHFVIEVPARSDLVLRVRAGDIRVEGIEGNKDIRMTAGDLDIEVNPRSYSAVRASVTFGDLGYRAVGLSKSGFRASFDWQGLGTYSLKASVFAGDITLR